MSRPRQSFFGQLLQQLHDPEISEIISKRDSTRIFDDLADKYGNRFNWILVNFANDRDELVRILKNIKKVRKHAELGVCFATAEDADKVTEWAKIILRHACREILNVSNEVDIRILRLLHKESSPTLARDFIYAYFATHLAHIMSDIAESLNKYGVHPGVFTAMTLLLKKCPEWIEQIWPMRPQGDANVAKWQCQKRDDKNIRFFGNLAQHDLKTNNVSNTNNNIVRNKF